MKQHVLEVPPHDALKFFNPNEFAVRESSEKFCALRKISRGMFRWNHVSVTSSAKVSLSRQNLPPASVRSKPRSEGRYSTSPCSNPLPDFDREMF